MVDLRKKLRSGMIAVMYAGTYLSLPIVKQSITAVKAYVLLTLQGL